jgi:hypothetical protein
VCGEAAVVLEWFYDIFIGAAIGAVVVVLLLKKTFVSLLLVMNTMNIKIYVVRIVGV